jgi:hypothetical protein
MLLQHARQENPEHVVVRPGVSRCCGNALVPPVAEQRSGLLISDKDCQNGVQPLFPKQSSNDRNLDPACSVSAHAEDH